MKITTDSIKTNIPRGNQISATDYTYASHSKVVEPVETKNISTINEFNDTKKAEFDLLNNETEEKTYYGSTSDRFLYSWVLVNSISAKLLEYYNDSVLLECLIHKDERIYEEREFDKSLFSEFDLKEGALFKIQLFERPSEQRIRILNKPGLVSESDFPQIDFEEKYKNSPIFKDNN